MALIDPDAVLIMALMDERLADQETIVRQREVIGVLTAALRAQIVLLASKGGDGD